MVFAGAASLEGQGRTDLMSCEWLDVEPASQASPASFSRSGSPLSSPYLAENGSSWELIRLVNISGLRHTIRGGGFEYLGDIVSRIQGAQASRARMIEITYLEFALALAEARLGLVAYRSTAPPPHVPV